MKLEALRWQEEPKVHTVQEVYGCIPPISEDMEVVGFRPTHPGETFVAWNNGGTMVMPDSEDYRELLSNKPRLILKPKPPLPKVKVVEILGDEYMKMSWCKPIDCVGRFYEGSRCYKIMRM